MMKKINIGLFICAVICLVYYDIDGGILLKGITSAWFVALGTVNLIYAIKMKVKSLNFVVAMELGLIFGWIADVVLRIHFIGGVLAFAVGHVCYIIAFYILKKFRWQDLYAIIPIAIVAIFIVVGTPFIHVDDPFIEKLLLAYAVIISFMLGKSVSNFIDRKSVLRTMLLIGSILFWFSDLMLALKMFGDGGELMGHICAYTYWPAQNILALALYRYVVENK